jgi:ABC-type Co2+ transport system permease subunit
MLDSISKNGRDRTFSQPGIEALTLFLLYLIKLSHHGPHHHVLCCLAGLLLRPSDTSAHFSELLELKFDI